MQVCACVIAILLFGVVFYSLWDDRPVRVNFEFWKLKFCIVVGDRRPVTANAESASRKEQWSPGYSQDDEAEINERDWPKAA